MTHAVYGLIGMVHIVDNFYKNKTGTAKSLSSFQFMIRLQEQLDEDSMRLRLSNTKLPHNLKENIKGCCGTKNLT